jgi:hypothetical protein
MEVLIFILTIAATLLLAGLLFLVAFGRVIADWLLKDEDDDIFKDLDV